MTIGKKMRLKYSRKMISILSGSSFQDMAYWCAIDDTQSRGCCVIVYIGKYLWCFLINVKIANRQSSRKLNLTFWNTFSSFELLDLSPRDCVSSIAHQYAMSWNEDPDNIDIIFLLYFNLIFLPIYTTLLLSLLMKAIILMKITLTGLLYLLNFRNADVCYKFCIKCVP
jgi:hypothetical protein